MSNNRHGRYGKSLSVLLLNGLYARALSLRSIYEILSHRQSWRIRSLLELLLMYSLLGMKFSKSSEGKYLFPPSPLYKAEFF